MSDDRDDIVCAVFGFGFGIYSFFRGFSRMRRKRLIENIPTSTVRGLALGLAEVSGRAKSIAVLESPLTKTACVLYQYKVEEYRRSGKSGHWATIAQGDSFLRPFWLDDTTGKVMVLAKGAEIILPADYTFSTRLGRSLPGNLTEFMQKNNIRQNTWLNSRPLRFTEWFICEDELVYVLGTAQKNDKTKDQKDELVKRIQQLKADPQKMKDVDTNKDGQVSIEEWDAAVARIEKEMLDETLAKSVVDNASDIIITKGEEEKIFMISDYSQDSLLRKLSWQCFWGIYGGAALSLATLAYLLFRLKFFNF